MKQSTYHSLLMALALLPVAASAQDLPVQSGSDSEFIERDDVRSGARKGAIAGAALGAMGGYAGAGAVSGAMAGGMYMYDQSRQDDRTQMLADAISTNRQPAAQETASAPAPAQPGTRTVQQGPSVQNNQPQVTVGDVGQSRLQNFVGDWDLDTWSLTANGDRLSGTGKAKGFSAGANATRVVITDFTAPDFPDAVGGGTIMLSYQPGQGFFLESEFAFSEETLKFVGEYMPDSGTYNFYLLSGSGGETATGVIRSSVRVEVRSSGAALWIADTYSYVDGQETQIQSYRFTRR